MSIYTLYNLGLNKVSVKIDHDPEGTSPRRTLTLQVEVTESDVADILSLTHQKADWSIDLHAESLQLPLATIEPVDNHSGDAGEAWEDKAVEKKPKARKSRKAPGGNGDKNDGND